MIGVNEIQEIFSRDFETTVSCLKEIFVYKQEYDHYLMSEAIEKFLQSLNIKKEYNNVKIFFDEIYNHVPNEQLKLKNMILNEYEISTKKIVLKSYPRTIEFALTNKCNFRCIMCDELSHSGNYSASDKMVNDLIALMPYLKCLILRGGEVFLDNRFDDILEQCEKNNVNVDIITNGSLLNNKNINKLLNNDRIVLTLSIDSLKKTTYENIRKHSVFDQLMYNINLLRDMKKKKKSKMTTGINMVVMSINYTEIENMIVFAGKNEFKFINLIPILHNSQYNLNRDILNKINVDNQKYLDIARKYNIDIFNRIPLNNDEKNSNDIIKEAENDKREIDIKDGKTDDENFCFKPFHYVLVDRDIVKPTCHCKMLEQKIETNENSNNIILSLWNGITFCNYRKAMFSNYKYKFCSEECIKNNLLFNL